ncbi:MAG: hypothetical protein ACYTGW_19235 [Planctomycetota bacterium]
MNLDAEDLATGLEVCLLEPPEILHGARFGLLCNQAAVDGQFRYAHTLLSEGRGTTTPFEVFGAPWLDPSALLDALAAAPDDWWSRAGAGRRYAG